MPILYNLVEKKVENVPDEVVGQVVANGTHSFRSGGRVPMVLPDSKRVYVPAEYARDALSKGAQFETQSMSKQLYEQDIQKRRQEIYAQNPGTAFAAGLLSGGTAGISDVALAATGSLFDEDFRQTLKGIKEANPKANMIGEIVGTGVGLAAPVGILPKIAKYGEMAATSAQVGRAATKLGSVFGKGTAKEVVERATKSAAGSAVEGLFYATGELASEAALGDPNMTAGRVVSTIGLGGVLGGGLGAFTSLGGSAARGTINALKSSALPSATADVVGKTYTKLLPLMRDMSEDEVAHVKRAFSSAEGRKRLFRYFENPQQLTDDAVKSVRDLDAVALNMESMAMDARKQARQEMVGKLTDVDAKEIDTINNSIDKIIAKIQDNPGTYNTGTATQLTDAWGRFQEKTIGKVERAGMKSTDYLINKADMHATVESLRKEIDSIAKMGLTVAPGLATNTKDLLKELRGKLQDHLRNEEIYGSFAKTYDDINRAYTTFKKVKEGKGGFDSLFTVERPAAIGDGAVKEVAPEKVASFFSDTQATLRKEARIGELEDVLGRLQKVADSTGKTSPGASKALQDRLLNFRQTIDNLKDIKTTAKMVDALQSRTGRSLMPMLMGGALGSVVGNPVIGAVVGNMVGNPRAVLRQLGRLENLSLSGYQQVQSTAGKFLGKPWQGKLLKSAETILPRITLDQAIDAFDPVGETEPVKSSDEKAQQLGALLRQHMDDPSLIDGMLAQSNPWLDSHAPGVYAAMHQQAMRAVGFLTTKLPAAQSGFFAGTPKMTLSERQRFEDSVDAVFRPSRIFEEVTQKRPNPQVVEAVRSVYPELFEDLKAGILKSVTESPDALTYDRRLALAQTFGIATMSSIENLDVIQANYVAEPQQVDNPMAAPQNVASRATELSA